MIKDTSGNLIYELICDCGFTGGCQKCNPLPSFIGSITNKEAKKMKKDISNFKKRFDRDLGERNKRLFGKGRGKNKIIKKI